LRPLIELNFIAVVDAQSFKGNCKNTRPSKEMMHRAVKVYAVSGRKFSFVTLKNRIRDVR